MDFIYSPDNWNLTKPKLILSVTGATKNFTMSHRIKKAFKEGLVKAAISTGAWIITSGTNTGVMRLVGEAVAEECPKYSSDTELTVLGIATGQMIYKRHLLVDGDHKEPILYAKDVKEEFYCGNKDMLLDPNHNNFILVDDGSVGELGSEIEFRECLETFVSTSNGSDVIPMVLIVVNGGTDTLKTVFESLKTGIPVLILSVNKY